MKVKANRKNTQATLASGTWKKVVLLAGSSGGTVYWRVIGTPSNKTQSTATSNVDYFVIGSPDAVGNARSFADRWVISSHVIMEQQLQHQVQGLVWHPGRLYRTRCEEKGFFLQRFGPNGLRGHVHENPQHRPVGLDQETDSGPREFDHLLVRRIMGQVETIPEDRHHAVSGDGVDVGGKKRR